MKRSRLKQWAAGMLAGMILAAAAAAGAGGLVWTAQAAAGSGDAPYTLSQTLKTGVKTILNERIADGTRIGAVVRLHNTAGRVTTVPDYELRAVTTGGVVYTLRPSADNPRLVQPQETIELSYMLTVKRADAFAIERLVWTSVDEYVYPKKETSILSMPARNLEWYGPATTFTDAGKVKEWGTPVTIPTESETLVYRPVRLAERHTPQGTTAVLVLEAANKGSRQAWLPDFTVTGKTQRGYYPAERAEKGEIAIPPGASRHLHFVMRLPDRQSWKSFTIATKETFTDASGTIEYEAGRLQIKPPARQAAQSVQNEYRLFQTIRIASTLQPNLAREVDVSLAELQRFEQTGDGYLTATAKFRLMNRSGVSVPVPHFGVEWQTSEGISYAGERMESRQRMLMPDVGLVIGYTFTLPLSAADDDTVQLTLLDGSPDTFELPVGAIRLEVPQQEPESIDMYPFELSVQSGAFTDKDESVVLELDVKRTANVTFDERNIRLKVEAADESGRVLASRTYPFAGTDRLAPGRNAIELGVGSRKPAGDVVIRLYEVLSAPSGTVERHVDTMRVKAPLPEPEEEDSL